MPLYNFGPTLGNNSTFTITSVTPATNTVYITWVDQTSASTGPIWWTDTNQTAATQLAHFQAQQQQAQMTNPYMNQQYQAYNGLTRAQERATREAQADSYRVAERQQQRVLGAHPKTAHDRAFELLMTNLNPEQQAMLKERGFFVVEGGRSKTKYRIRGGTLIANIDVMIGESVHHRLCAHADAARFPIADSLLAQKLMLEADEDRFLRIANRHGR